MTNRISFRTAVGVVLLLVAGPSRLGHAQNVMIFNGGPAKNLYIDLIFWGNFCGTSNAQSNCVPQQDVKDYINNLSGFLNGNYGSPFLGLEPAVHYYGVNGIIGGQTIGFDDPLGQYAPPGNTGLDITKVGPIVQQAQNGSMGTAYDWSGNATSRGLASGANRLPVLVTLGANTFLSPLMADDGFHIFDDVVTNEMVAAVQWEHRDALSHEIFETMTDPMATYCPCQPPGWTSYLQNIRNPATEIGDQCEGEFSYGGSYFVGSSPSMGDGSDQLAWKGTAPSHHDISGITSVTVNAPFAYIYPYTDSAYPFATASCELFIPEQNAPMSATLESGYASDPIVLYYRNPNGELEYLYWMGVGSTANGPYDIGTPSSSVTAVGRPAVVYSPPAGGEYVFTRGSDQGLWMYHNRAWTPLGGLIYGDPSPVIVDYGQIIYVFGVGLDDQLYYYGLANNALYGWNEYPNPSGAFVGSPAAISRSAASLDVFLAGENGQLEWIDYLGGWSESQRTNQANEFVTTAPGVSVEQGTGNIDVLWTDGLNMWDDVWTQTYGWLGAGNYRFTLPYPQNNYGVQGTPAVVSAQSGRTDAFAVSRNGELWWWYSIGANLFQSGNMMGNLAQPLVAATNVNSPIFVGSTVTGSPVAVSRGAGEMEVFFRQNNSTLVHLTYNGGEWDVGGEEFIPAASIQ